MWACRYFSNKIKLCSFKIIWSELIKTIIYNIINYQSLFSKVLFLFHVLLILHSFLKKKNKKNKLFNFIFLYDYIINSIHFNFVKLLFWYKNFFFMMINSKVMLPINTLRTMFIALIPSTFQRENQLSLKLRKRLHCCILKTYFYTKKKENLYKIHLLDSLLDSE